jgi:hypothetical protein
MRASFRKDVDDIVIVSEDRGLIEWKVRDHDASRDGRELAMERSASEGEDVVDVGPAVSNYSLALRTFSIRTFAW